MPSNSDQDPTAAPRVCQWVNQSTVLKHFARYDGPTQSQQHIKPLHWYAACRLVLEGGFHPDELKPRPPFTVTKRRGQYFIHFDPSAATGGEATVLGGAQIGLLRRSERLIGAYYRNELAHRLRKAGFALRPSMIGPIHGFEIAGWPKATLEAFSSRRREILDYIRERGWRYDERTAQAATLATRKRKQEPRREALQALWSKFAAERGLAKQKRRSVGVRNPEPATTLEIAWRAVAQMEERASVFPRLEAPTLLSTPTRPPSKS